MNSPSHEGLKSGLKVGFSFIQSLLILLCICTARGKEIEDWKGVKKYPFSEPCRPNQLRTDVLPFPSETAFLCYGPNGEFDFACTYDCAGDFFGTTFSITGYMNSHNISYESRGCNGDPVFCDFFGCDTNWYCYCKGERHEVVTLANCGSGWFPFDTYHSMNITIGETDYESVTNIDDLVGTDEVINLSKVDGTWIMRILPKRNGKKFALIQKFYTYKNTSYSLMTNAAKGNFTPEVNELKLRRVRAEGNDAYEIEFPQNATSDVAFLEDDHVLNTYNMVINEYTIVNASVEQEVLTCDSGNCTDCEGNWDYVSCRVENPSFLEITTTISILLLLICTAPWWIAMCTGCFKMMKCMWVPGCSIMKKCWKLDLKKRFRKKEYNDLEKMDKKKQSKSKGNVELDSYSSETDLSSDKTSSEEFDIQRLRDLGVENPIRPSSKKSKGVRKNPGQRERPAKKPSSRNNQKMFIIMFALAIGFSEVSYVSGQCSNNVVAHVETEVCTSHNNTHKTCSVKPKVTFSFKGPGEKSCVTLLDTDERKIGSVELQLNAIKHKAALVKQYYTSVWEYDVETNSNCWGGGCCSISNYESCTEFYDDFTDNPCGMFSDLSMSLPGKTGCLSAPGGWSNGCGMFLDKCNYYRFFINPIAASFKVSKPGLETRQAIFSVTGDLPGISDSSQVIDDPIFETEDFRMEISGLMEDYDFNLDKYVVQLGNTHWYADASEPNKPQAGMVGDIQSNSPEDLKNAGPGTFIWDKEILEVNAIDSGVSANVMKPGIAQVDNYPKFPAVIDGFLWKISPSADAIETYINRYFSVQVELTFKKQINYLIDEELACPSIDDVNMIGCHSCSAGAILNLTAHSTCLSSVCVLEFDTDEPSLSQNTISLSRKTESFELRVLTTRKSFSDKLRIVCNGGQAEISVEGLLVEADTIFEKNDSRISHYDNVKEFDEEKGDWLENLFPDVSRWVKILIYIGCSLILTIIGVILMYIVTKVLRKLFTNKNKNKTKADDLTFKSFLAHWSGMNVLRKVLAAGRKKSVNQKRRKLLKGENSDDDSDSS